MLAPGSAPEAIAEGLVARGLTINRLVGYESSHVGALADKGAVVIGLYRMAEWAVHLASFGRMARGMTDFFLVARRPV
jgi:hypothetical protein